LTVFVAALMDETRFVASVEPEATLNWLAPAPEATAVSTAPAIVSVFVAATEADETSISAMATAAECPGPAFPFPSMGSGLSVDSAPQVGVAA
jgi:hypothetical protein